MKGHVVIRVAYDDDALAAVAWHYGEAKSTVRSFRQWAVGVVEGEIESLCHEHEGQRDDEAES